MKYVELRSYFNGCGSRCFLKTSTGSWSLSLERALQPLQASCIYTANPSAGGNVTVALKEQWSIRRRQSFWWHSWGQMGQCGWFLFFPPWNSRLWAPVGWITRVLEGAKPPQKAGQTPEHTLELLSKLRHRLHHCSFSLNS